MDLLDLDVRSATSCGAQVDQVGTKTRQGSSPNSWPGGVFPLPRKKLRAAMKSLTKSWERDLKDQESAQIFGLHLF